MAMEIPYKKMHYSPDLWPSPHNLSFGGARRGQKKDFPARLNPGPNRIHPEAGFPLATIMAAPISLLGSLALIVVIFR
jgi:hypothetical protein